MNRREFIACATVATSALTLPITAFSAETPPVFQQRGYYLCYMRMPDTP